MKIKRIVILLFLSISSITIAKSSLADRVELKAPPTPVPDKPTPTHIEKEKISPPKTADKQEPKKEVTKEHQIEKKAASKENKKPNEKPSDEKLEDKKSKNNGAEKANKDHNTLVAEEQKPIKEWKENKVRLNFENASLQTVLDDIADLFELVFIPDEAVKIGDDSDKKTSGAASKDQPKSLAETRVTFRTFDPLTKHRTLSILDLFLQVAGLARVPMSGMPDNYFRITEIKTANRSYLPTFIGVESEGLPDTGVIRYIYFLKNINAESALETINQLKSPNAEAFIFKESNAIIITDNSFNIKSLMRVVRELDDHGFPDILSVLKLKEADAQETVDLFKSLQGDKAPSSTPMYGTPKPASKDNLDSSYFASSTRMIADSRTNSLIILGKKDAVEKAEEFIKNYVDKSLKEQPSLFHVVDLNWVNAPQIATILNDIVKYGKTSSGGDGARSAPRLGAKFFSNMAFEAEPNGNKLIVRGKKEEFQLIKPVIERLDRKQPQVAIEILIIEIDLNNNKGLQTRMRNPSDTPQLFEFQTTTGFGSGVVYNGQSATPPNSLLANLITLAQNVSSGGAIMTLGKTSVWAIMSMMQEIKNTNIISNPFLVATNKYPATISSGETRRITSGTITGGFTPQETKTSADANLTVTVTPQINSSNNINLDINVTIKNFTGTAGDIITNGNTESKTVKTIANVTNEEVLALGGIIVNKNTNSKVRVPILGSLPFIGNLFKSTKNEIEKTNLVIFMRPKIIRTRNDLREYTEKKASVIKIPLQAKDTLLKTDPIERYFFGNPNEHVLKKVNEALSTGLYTKDLTHLADEEEEA